jgi:hypothetical protein
LIMRVWIYETGENACCRTACPATSDATTTAA